MQVLAVALTFALLPCPQLDTNQQALAKLEVSVPSVADLDQGLRSLFAHLDSTNGIHLRTWVEDQIDDPAVRAELEQWASRVFVEHPDFLDGGAAFIDTIKNDIPKGDLWARFEPHSEYWLLWDALERFGWDAVGVEDDGDDARTVRESLQWLAKNDEDGTTLRMWLDENFKGLYAVYRSYSLQEALALLHGDYAPTITQLLPKDAVPSTGGLKGFVLEEDTTKQLLGDNPLIAGVEVWGFWNPQITAIPGIIDQFQLRHVLDHARTALKTDGLHFQMSSAPALRAQIEPGIYGVAKPQSGDIDALISTVEAYANGGRVFQSGGIFMVERHNADELIVLRVYQPQ